MAESLGTLPAVALRTTAAFAELQFGNLCQNFSCCIRRMTLNIMEHVALQDMV